jgi:hypothetical protein
VYNLEDLISTSSGNSFNKLIAISSGGHEELQDGRTKNNIIIKDILPNVTIFMFILLSPSLKALIVYGLPKDNSI